MNWNKIRINFRTPVEWFNYSQNKRNHAFTKKYLEYTAKTGEEYNFNKCSLPIVVFWEI